VDGHDVDLVVDLLVMDNTARELREMASELGASRERGANKRETASAIAYQADGQLEVREGPGGELRVVPDPYDW
jgi:hypothetical protein